MRMPDKATSQCEFSLANLACVSSAIQKSQGFHPKTQLSSGLPTNQKLFERLVHRVERVCTKQQCLEVRWVVHVIGGGFEIQRYQLSLVHLRQLSRRGQQA